VASTSASLRPPSDDKIIEVCADLLRPMVAIFGAEQKNANIYDAPILDSGQPDMNNFVL
jgi:hypothetical protein